MPVEGNGDLQDTDLCPCGETQTMSHTVESCPVTKLNDGLSRTTDDPSHCTVNIHTHVENIE